DRLPPAAPAAVAIPAAATMAEAAAATAAAVVTPEPLVITPDIPASNEPLVPEAAPALPVQEEPEYPSDAVLPESLPGQAPGSVTLYPQAGQP
ncbi:murein L,D-transpeptidase, partial [Paracoccus versutus]|nr:murein L,D-transpeptidase [Paracoccus versutus]